MGDSSERKTASVLQQDQQPTLTAAEREAIIVASIELNALACVETNHADKLRGLLARFS